MKRLTAIFEDDVNIPVGPLADLALELKIEKVKDGKKARRIARRTKGFSTQDAVMKHFTPSGRFTLAHATKWVESEGFAGKSASPALTHLKKGGLIKQNGRGDFVFLKPAETCRASG